MEEKTPEQFASVLIKDTKRSGDNFLYLKGLDLTFLPSEIGQLTKLEELLLESNKLTSLPPEIGQLANLKIHNVSDNPLANLPKEIGRLRKLEKLIIGGGLFNESRLTNLPKEIGQLSNLTMLSLSFNKLTTLPPEICRLTNLQHLFINGNQLNSLPSEIWSLTKLITLDLGGFSETDSISSEKFLCNQLTILPRKIENLVNLEKLDLRNNNLVELPVEIRNLKKLKELDLRGNKLEIPPEILEKVYEPQTILNFYFSVFTTKISKVAAIDMETSGVSIGKRLNETKLLFVGQGSVGKTSIIRRLLDNTYDPEEDKTDGIDIRKYNFLAKDNTYTINTWDFGGQEIMHATHQFFLTKRSLSR